MTHIAYLGSLGGEETHFLYFLILWSQGTAVSPNLRPGPHLIGCSLNIKGLKGPSSWEYGGMANEKTARTVIGIKRLASVLGHVGYLQVD